MATELCGHSGCREQSFVNPVSKSIETGSVVLHAACFVYCLVPFWVKAADFEFAAACSIFDRIKAGDGIVPDSRRWSTFEDLLIPEADWQSDRLNHCANLGLPIDQDQFIAAMQRQLESITATVDAAVPKNDALTIDVEKDRYHLSRPKKTVDEKATKPIKPLIQANMPQIDLSELLIDIDNATDFLRPRRYRYKKQFCCLLAPNLI